MELRSLTADDRQALSEFECAQYRAPWTEPIQEVIRESLSSCLERGSHEALGLWDDEGGLLGLVAWTVGADPTIWTSSLLAVAKGHVRRGYGRKLKTALIERARSAGAVRIDSQVHRDNKAMTHLNEKVFGADGFVDPEGGQRDRMIYTVWL